ncbi:ABC transporter permease [Paenibacillus sp. HW567]|uniref:ABC transporter permease n=1 Tax=Paenibacillus sp. HW567 TaxID=1034769 RepID=UPI00036C5705|nr:ABC transporter permease [Paenibacillus sp. HW567]
MYNLIWADLYKLRKAMAIKILFGITTLSAAAMAIMAYLIPQHKIDESLTDLGFLFSDVNVISILGAVIAGVFICGDFDNKTIHNAIAAGSGRGAVIVSKTIVFCCALAFILLPYVIITGIALGTNSDYSMGSVALGFLHLMTSGAGSGLSASGGLKLLGISLTLMIVYMAQLSITVPLAFVLKKPVLVVAIFYGLSILSGQLGRLADSSPRFDRIFAATPFSGNYALMTINSGAAVIFKAIAVSLIFLLVMLAITYSVFRRTEIK